MKKISVSSCALVIFLSIAGCGGSGGDSLAPILLSGFVKDGPIGDSTISLRDNASAPLSICGPQGTSLCETKTDATGSFSLAVKAGTDLANLSVQAVGVDFIGPELIAPLALFAEKLTEVVISPLTTLVAALQNQGLSLFDAQKRIRDWLLLPVVTDLAINPSLSPEAKSVNLLLSKVALEINVKDPDAQPFSLIAEQIFNSNNRFFANDGTTCNAEVMDALGLDAEAQKRVELLIGSHPLYRVVSPLLLTELPGSDNQQRAAYFFGSDLSPHFRAEQLIWRIYDDAINDAVLLKIAEGKANAGLIDETWVIIATQIVQSEPKAHAYWALANTLIKFNRMEEARSALNLARDLYRQVIAAKGAASATSTDVANLIATSSSYQKAGDLSNAQSLLDDVAAIASYLVSDAATYGRLITGIKNVADAYIAAGDIEAAAPLVQAMEDYSEQTPALAGTYKLRIYNWSETAKRYADLADPDAPDRGEMVLQVYAKIKALRAADAATATATWVYVPSLVESLYRVGETTLALELANTIPSGSPYLGSAFKLVATYEALQGNMETAFSIVDNSIYFLADEDKVDLLTYYAANRKNSYIALSLINAVPDRFGDARLALEKAEGLLEGMTQSTNLARIRYGYVKVAELYALMGEPSDIAKAEYLLGRAQAVIIDDIYRVAVMVDIALGYHNLNQPSVALSLLASAQSLADANPTWYRTDAILNLSSAEAATALYEAFIKAYEMIGEKNLVHMNVVNLFLPWAQAIHTAETVNDALAGKECVSLLRAALYLEGSGYHDAALNALAAAKESAGQIAVVAPRLKNFLSIISTYAVVHEYDQALSLALSLEYTTERNQAIQTLANAYIDRDDFPESAVASIDSDGDGQPDFFHPLASAAEITASNLILDNDSDGDDIVDTDDVRPLFAD